jgi:hypothetical protein
MGRRESSNSSFLSNRKRKVKSSTGTVAYVHIDDSEFQTITLPEGTEDKLSDKEFQLGFAKIVTRKDSSYDLADIPSYPPYNIEEGLPLIGETVQLLTVGGKVHYKRLYNPDINKGNAEEDALLQGYPTEEETSSSSNYGETSQTGTPNSDGDGDRKTKFGEYFESTKISPLKYYEGDKIIQSRFGQSIRFSGYNNEENVLAPTIIIRNRQNDKSLEELKEFEITEEDIVEDGSTIAITSGDYLLEWTPGTEEGPFDTEPVYYEPPSELKGTDQILVNSGRIILSSKDSEMIFFSKGNISLVSDGKFTLDNGNDGAFIDLNGEYRTTTNDNNMYFLGGSGEIYLNTEATTEPLARGQTLIDILSEILDELQAEIHPTPAGPSSPPTNAPKYAAIQGKLDTILSTLNYTE